MAKADKEVYSTGRRLAAWSVHLFTASGLLAGFMGLLAAEQRDWRAALLWLLLCQFIDGVDGLLARAVQVRKVLPGVDGKNIDYVIDFFTYAILPTYIFFHALELAYPWSYIGAFVMLLSAAIYYGLEGMVSEDGKHFVGFPVMWNLVVYFQIVIFPFWPDWALLGATFFFGILHFVPIHFAYPSQGRGQYLPWLLAIGFLLSFLINVWLYPQVSWIGKSVSIVTTLGFAGLAIQETSRVWRSNPKP